MEGLSEWQQEGPLWLASYACHEMRRENNHHHHHYGVGLPPAGMLSDSRIGSGDWQPLVPASPQSHL